MHVQLNRDKLKGRQETQGDRGFCFLLTGTMVTTRGLMVSP